jgi:hypothetical protein
MLHRYDEAVGACKLALQLKPDFALARNNLAWAKAERGARRTNTTVSDVEH